MNNQDQPQRFPGDDRPTRDAMDDLLRAWHDENAQRALAGRDRLLAAIRGSGAAPRRAAWRRILLHPGLRAAACLALFAALLAIFALPHLGQRAVADAGIVQVPDGGRLDAVDADGNLVGPCPLRHTDVQVDLGAHIARVLLTQTFHNPYPFAIEAVYTFPLGHRGAVDRMRMIVGERIVVAEVRERGAARRIYEAARDRGDIASLLEQERPNIFTQSVANIGPGETIRIEIGYVELLERVEGVYEFVFPTVVGPRYIPGGSSAPPAQLPPGLAPRVGVVLRGPAALDPAPDAAFDGPALSRLLGTAVAIQHPGDGWLDRVAAGAVGPLAGFTARYADGSGEIGDLFDDGVGRVGDRWFFAPGIAAARGTGYAAGTDQVPDAGRITPQPVRPPTRAGHDLSIRVALDSGGPAIDRVESVMHAIDEERLGAGRRTIVLRNQREIPNRDFVLRWATPGTAVQESALVAADPRHGAFVTLALAPPPRAAEAIVRPRELVFVLDTSGSMGGFPIEKSKAIMRIALEQMRAEDRFNIVTFAGATAVLWPEPRAATPEAVAEAQAFVEQRQGSGGTEMMAAIEAALRQPEEAADRRVRLCVFLTDGYVGNDQAIIDAVRRHAGSTRVFAMGIGNSVNRWLLEQMALAGRGVAEFVTLAEEADAAVERLARRIRTPLLTDIAVRFEGVEVDEIVPGVPSTAPGVLPDLFDERPILLHARVRRGGTGSVVVSGRTGAGAWERRLPLTLPEGIGGAGMGNAALPVLWARSRVEQLLAPHLTALQEERVDPAVREEVVALGEGFQIVTPFTSFVAVEKRSMNLGGRPVLVPVPVELPEGTRWEGFFGEDAAEGGRDVAWDDLLVQSAPWWAGSKGGHDGAMARSRGGAAAPGSAGVRVAAEPETAAPPPVRAESPPPPPPPAPAATSAGIEAPELRVAPANAARPDAIGSPKNEPAERLGVSSPAVGAETLSRLRLDAPRERPRFDRTAAGEILRAAGSRTQYDFGVSAPPTGGQLHFAPGGGGGGFGGGSGGGGGGSIFGSPGDDPGEFGVDERAELVAMVVGAEFWRDFGGALLDFGGTSEDDEADETGADGDGLVVTVLVPTPQAEAIAAQARAVVAALESWEQDPRAAGERGSTSPILLPALQLAPDIEFDGADFDRLPTVLYPVQDLLPQGDGAKSVVQTVDAIFEIIELVETTIEPEVWLSMGGNEARAWFMPAAIVVKAPERIQASVVNLLEALRLLRQDGTRRVAWDDRCDLRSIEALARLGLDALGVERVAAFCDERDATLLAAGSTVAIIGEPQERAVLHELLDELDALAGGEAMAGAAQRRCFETALPLAIGSDLISFIHAFEDIAEALRARTGENLESAAQRVGDALLEEAVELPQRLAEAVGQAPPRGEVERSGALIVARLTVRQHLAIDAVADSMRRSFQIPPRRAERTLEVKALHGSGAEAGQAEATRRRERLATLWRRLEPALFAAVVPREDPTGSIVRPELLVRLGFREAGDGDRAGDAGAGPDAATAVSVLVDGVDPDRVDGLKAAGLAVERAFPESSLLVGWVHADRLVELALSDGVRRIERVR